MDSSKFLARKMYLYGFECFSGGVKGIFSSWRKQNLMLGGLVVGHLDKKQRILRQHCQQILSSGNRPYLCTNKNRKILTNLNIFNYEDF